MAGGSLKGVGEMLKDDIQQFLSELAISKSPETVSSYQCGLVSYVKLYGEFTVENVMGFASWLHQNRTRATLHLYLTAIARFAKWLKKTKRLSVEDYADLIERLEDVRGGRVKQALPKVPKEVDVIAIVGAAQNAFDPGDTDRKRLMELRNIAIIHTLRATGCRVSEVANLRRDALRESEKAATVTGKGSKQRTIFFDDTAWSAVVTYLTARDAVNENVGAGEPVFCRYDRLATGRVLAISANVIRNVINKLEKGHTLEHLWPHRFRHRFGTRVLQQTHDLAATQDLMGHTNPATSRIYAKLDDEYRQKAHQSVSL